MSGNKYHVVSYFSRHYLVGALGCSSFFFNDFDSKYVVSPRTTHLSSQSVDSFIYGNNFVSFQSRYYSSMSH